MSVWARTWSGMTLPPVSYKRHRFPAEIIARAVWLYFRFPLSLRLVEEMLLERGIVVSYETIRRWAIKFGADYARRLRRKSPSAAIFGIWTRSSSQSTVRSVGFGAPSIRTGMSSMKLFKPTATQGLRNAC